MIQKIKDLMAIKEQLDSITTAIDEHSKSFSVLSGEVKGLKEDVNGVKKDVAHIQDEFLKDFKTNLDFTKELVEEFKTELNNFKVEKSQVTKKMVERSSDELNEHFDKLKTDIGRYNELKSNVVQISERINSLGGEIDKFNKIASKLKEADYDLTKFAKQIFEADKEKLELLKKIDTLERLIARQRRKH